VHYKNNSRAGQVSYESPDNARICNRTTLFGGFNIKNKKNQNFTIQSLQDT
jgi:hypothetical protein